MKKLLVYFLTLFIFLNITACDYKDIDRRVFIITLGIDIVDDNNIEIIAKGAIPQNRRQQTSENYAIYTVTDTSIPNALRKLKARTALEPDYSHLKNLIIGEEYAQEGNIEQLAEFFLNRRDFQNIMYVLVGSDSAESIIMRKPEGEITLGSDIFLAFGQGSRSVYSHRVTLKDLFCCTQTPGISPSCPMIRVGKDDMVIDQIAIFNKRNLELTLKDNEVKIFNILYREVGEGFLEAVDPESKQKIGANIKKTKRKIKIAKENNYYICNVNIQMEIQMELKPTDKNSKEDLVTLLQRSLKNDVEQLLNKFKESKVDPLKFQVEYWKSNLSYELSDKWLEEVIPRMTYKVNVELYPFSGGLVK